MKRSKKTKFTLSTNSHPLTVGWREYVSLPEWGVTGIRAKADTGARTSAIDVANIEEIDDTRVRFDLVIDRADPSHRVSVEAEVVRRTRVKSSFGAGHDRLIVQTRMSLGGVEKDVELSLVCRKKMLCRMLLGRKALEEDFLVDPSQCYLFGRKRRTRRREGKTS